MSRENFGGVLVAGIVLAIVGVVVAGVVSSVQKEEAHKQALLESCMSTGKPLYKCTLELSQKPRRTFDINLGFGRKE